MTKIYDCSLNLYLSCALVLDGSCMIYCLKLNRIKLTVHYFLRYHIILLDCVGLYLFFVIVFSISSPSFLPTVFPTTRPVCCKCDAFYQYGPGLRIAFDNERIPSTDAEASKQVYQGRN